MSTKQDVEKAIGRSMVFEKTFPATGTFEAVGAAEKWLKENGYAYGSMQRDAPIGIAREEETSYISKWRNLGGDASLLNGAMVSDDFREGSVTIVLDHEPGGSV